MIIASKISRKIQSRLEQHRFELHWSRYKKKKKFFASGPFVAAYPGNQPTQRENSMFSFPVAVSQLKISTGMENTVSIYSVLNLPMRRSDCKIKSYTQIFDHSEDRHRVIPHVVQGSTVLEKQF